MSARRPVPVSRPSLSITLPSNFEFHYSDGQLPKTPVQQQDVQPLAADVPQPPRPQFKVRRRRAAIPDFDNPDIMPATVIPTIEMSGVPSEISSPMLQPTTASAGLLAPFPAIQRLVTPPKTPAPRLRQSFESPIESPPANEWALISDTNRGVRPAFDRSASVCSSFSDSSVSSCGDSDFSAPQTVASPQSEATDPFTEDDINNADPMTLSPDVKADSSPYAKRVKIHRNIKHTQAMDDHLWMVYMQYLSDPRVTPFKMLPGTAPPLGVCSRVATKARRSWGQYRATTPNSLYGLIASDRMQRDGSPDTIRPDVPAKQPQWPRSDSSTRRRLRVLCKRKPSLSAHYQRLLQTRSPSPFHTSSTTGRASDPPHAFSSRDMNVSLIAATAPSMQLEGPLAQLSSDDVPLAASQRSSRPADWFARIPRSQAHQKSLSLQSGLSLDTSVAGTTRAAPLASPFDAMSSRTHLLQSMGATKSLGRADLKGPGPKLDSPVELSGAPTMPRSLKRRFRSDEEKPRRPALQDVFGPPAEPMNIEYSSSAPRTRGFTVGAVRATDNLANLFTTPPAQQAAAKPDLEMTEAPPPAVVLGHFGSRSVPRRLAEPVPRLGSPFTETPCRQFNTFPRSYLPTSSNPQPFQQRLQELVAETVGKGLG